MTSTEITTDTVLVQTRHCVVRPQEQSYVVYNPRTDELHLLPQEAYLAYALCDGLHSIGDIEAYLRSWGAERAEEVRPRLRELFDKLIARGILELGEADQR